MKVTRKIVLWTGAIGGVVLIAATISHFLPEEKKWFSDKTARDISMAGGAALAISTVAMFILDKKLGIRN